MVWYHDRRQPTKQFFRVTEQSVIVISFRRLLALQCDGQLSRLSRGCVRLFQVLPVPANRQRLDRLPPPLRSVSAMGPNHAHLQHSYCRVHCPNNYPQSRYAFTQDTSPWDSNRLTSFHCFLSGWSPLRTAPLSYIFNIHLFVSRSLHAS